MCTATWLIRPDGYELFFNRDERLERGIARGPERREIGGVRVLMPLDPDAGGTWLGVNEAGLALALLNGVDARGALAEPRSRGLLVRDLVAARTAAQVLAALGREDLGRYRGFTLAVFEPGYEPRVRTWDGRALVETEARIPLSSSSLDGGRAQRERERAFARHGGRDAAPGREALATFQASHEPERGPWSACMHRPDAATVSASQVRVDAGEVALRYAPGPPCTTAFGPWLSLARAQRQADPLRPEP